ncbi:ExbD/TolR family protein [Kiritimatiella glycovorans]|uniref:Colicin uptake protein TolR n=1 Tax=Kiritimatiella glycovorans TaxID=1307763 RepID=A0A0G3EDH2_9BACT|nr:biopolymer transporter ExbD [Kiritimatiella glycovorans]AKJ64363.1 colicin uptake protein TolR [Kiritimatiella glycovorans]
MKLNTGKDRRRARIEMLPLIDVVFLLLVFFIYAMLSMVVHRGIEVQLPGAASAQTDQRESVTVSIDRDRSLFVEGRETSLSELAARVRAARGRRGTNLPVWIEGHREAPLDIAVGALDALRSAGITEVSFACERKPDISAP